MTATERLIEAIGYPRDEVSPAGGAHVLKVDGWRLRVWEDRGRLVMGRLLGEVSDETLHRLAALATGRLLREEAVLAWDPDAGEPLLWQGVDANAPAETLKLAFEAFCTSADWWAARLDENAPGAAVPGMVIRP